MQFEWDDRKAEINLRKHTVSFDVAKTVFADPLAVVEEDIGVYGEQRLRIIGCTDRLILLAVAYVERTGDDVEPVVRIISARRAGAFERRRYEAENDEPKLRHR